MMCPSLEDMLFDAEVRLTKARIVHDYDAVNYFTKRRDSLKEQIEAR